MGEEDQEDKYDDLLSYTNDRIDYLESKINKLQDTLTTFKIIFSIIGFFFALYLYSKYDFLLELTENIFVIIFAVAYILGGAIFCYKTAKEHYSQKRYADTIAMVFIWFFFGGGIIIFLYIWGFLFW